MPEEFSDIFYSRIKFANLDSLVLQYNYEELVKVYDTNAGWTAVKTGLGKTVISGLTGKVIARTMSKFAGIVGFIVTEGFFLLGDYLKADLQSKMLGSDEGIYTNLRFSFFDSVANRLQYIEIKLQPEGSTWQPYCYFHCDF